MTADGSFLSRVSRTKAPPPKEKFVSIMEGIFDGSLSGLRRRSREFWDELFLLGCNARAVTELVASSSTDTLHARRESISALCRECVDRIGDGALLRRSRALELLCVVLLQISRAPFPERSLGVINTCAGGQDTCDGFFEDLISRCATCAASHDLPVTLRRLAVRAMLTVVAGVDDNLNRNALVQYFMMHDVYEPVMKVLIAPVDVPGGGVSSETHEGATALAHGAGGFGSDTGIDGDEKNENENAAADDGGESEERKRAKRGAALGTTHERAALRTEAGYLLALLLSWRETRNAYTLRLNDADGVEMSVILRAACAMLSAPKDPSDPNDILGSMYAAGLPADPGEFIAGINQNVAAAVGMAPEPDGVMADLMRRLDYEVTGGGGGNALAGWETGPAPCAALLLLHALMRDSALLRKPATWLDLTPKPDELLHGVPISRRWHEALGRMLCFVSALCSSRRRMGKQCDSEDHPRRLPAGVTVSTAVGTVTAEEEQGWWDWLTGNDKTTSPFKLSGTRRCGKWVGTGSSGTGTWVTNDGESSKEEFAAGTALLAVASLRALLDDASAAEFLHATDAGRLAPQVETSGAVSADGSNSGVSSVDVFSLASSLGAAVGLGTSTGGTHTKVSTHASMPVASAVLELLSLVLIEGAPGKVNSTSPASVESHAVYVIHRALETQVARGGRVLAVRWESLWLGLMSTLRRCADGGADALGSPHVAALAAQCVNLINFVLAHGGAVCQSDAELVPLVQVLREEEGTLAKIAHGAGLNGYLVDAADVASMSRRRNVTVSDDDEKAGFDRPSRVGVRMETIHAVQSHFRSVPAGDAASGGVVMGQALSMFRAPVGDRLDAAWALGTTLGGGSGAGAGRGVGGDAARTERAAASSARALVGELLEGPLGTVPAGLRPKIRVPR